MLWDQKPDDSLVAEAAQGQLETTGDLADVVRRMLDDPRATYGVGAFYRRWLELDGLATMKKDPTLFPALTPELQVDMANETTTFGVDVTLTMNGSFQTLMTAPFSWIDARLAAIYGVAGVSGDLLQRTPLPADARAGLLTQPALQMLGSLATRNSPSHRGALILKKFFCEQVPLAPPGVPALGTAPPPGETVRQALANELAASDCAACHAAIDPPGLAFEGFDPIGRVRTTDNGVPVDTSNLPIILPRPDTNRDVTVVDGPIALAKVLSTDAGVEACMARQWLSFALGRDVTDADEPSARQVEAAFSAAGYNLRELIVAVLTSDAFLSP